MSTAAAAKRTAEQVLGKDKIVSSDSHIMEPPDLWERYIDLAGKQASEKDWVDVAKLHLKKLRNQEKQP